MTWKDINTLNEILNQLRIIVNRVSKHPVWFFYQFFFFLSSKTILMKNPKKIKKKTTTHITQIKTQEVKDEL